jgi:hypothetical protein
MSVALARARFRAQAEELEIITFHFARTFPTGVLLLQNRDKMTSKKIVKKPTKKVVKQVAKKLVGKPKKTIAKAPAKKSQQKSTKGTKQVKKTVPTKAAKLAGKRVASSTKTKNLKHKPVKQTALKKKKTKTLKYISAPTYKGVGGNVSDDFDEDEVDSQAEESQAESEEHMDESAAEEQASEAEGSEMEVESQAEQSEAESQAEQSEAESQAELQSEAESQAEQQSEAESQAEQPAAPAVLKRKRNRRELAAAFTKTEIVNAVKKMISLGFLVNGPQFESLNKISVDVILKCVPSYALQKLHEILVEVRRAEAEAVAFYTQADKEVFEKLGGTVVRDLVAVVKSIQGLAIPHLHNLNKKDLVLRIVQSGRGAEVVAALAKQS